MPLASLRFLADGLDNLPKPPDMDAHVVGQLRVETGSKDVPLAHGDNIADGIGGIALAGAGQAGLVLPAGKDGEGFNGRSGRARYCRRRRRAGGLVLVDWGEDGLDDGGANEDGLKRPG